MNQSIKNVLKILMSLGIGVAILYIVYLKNNAAYQLECIEKGVSLAECNFIDKIFNDVKSAHFLWVFIALGFYVISNVSRAIRWGMLLEPLGHKPKFLNSFSTVLVNHLANLGIPRSGEFVRAGLIAKYENYEPEKVMGTIVTSRILDVLCLLIAIALTLILSFDNFAGYFSENATIQEQVDKFLSPSLLATLALSGIIILFLIWKYRSTILSTKIGKKVWDLLLGFWEGILTIKGLRSPWIFVMHTVLIWICYYLMTYLMFFSFAPTADLAPVAGLVVFVFGTLGIVIPTPGGMGSYQFLISEGLMLYTVPFAEAFSFANIMFFSVQLLNVTLGLIAFVSLPIYNRNA